MKTIETSELIGAALDYAVGRANGWLDYPTDSIEKGVYWHTDPAKAPYGHRMWKEDYQPSTNWEQGGPVIERVGIAISKVKAIKTRQWVAGLALPSKAPSYGPTPLVAAMRCYVTQCLGNEVKIPRELL